MTFLIEAAIASTIIFATAFALLFLLRRQSAALRHWVLAAAVGVAALSPAMGRILPTPVAVPIGSTIASAVRPSPGGPSMEHPSPAMPVGQVREASQRDLTFIVWTVWIAGSVLSVFVIAIGLLQLLRLRASATRLTSGTWFDLAAEIARRHGMRHPVVLLEGRHPSMLVTWGLLRPKLILPAAAQAWPPERARIVLSHELAHIRRGDWIVQLAAESLKAVFWFNPLAWLACSRLRHESELAADDVVLNCGYDGTAYAEHLVEIARDLKDQRRLWSAAPAIACPTSLERRVRAMLTQGLNRRPLSRTASTLVVVVLLAAAVPAAGIAAVEQIVGSLSGSITDKTNGAMPGVTLVLTNTQTGQKYEVVTNASGRYQVEGLVQGDYTFEAKLPGFSTFRGKLTVAGQSLQQDLTMEVGSLMETITVANSRSNPETPVVVSPRPALAKRPIPTCGSATNTTNATALRVGGNIRAPRKVKDVRPLYSAALASKGIEGTVTLRATIDTEGNVSDVTVVSAPHPDLAAAAVDAVKQWEFDATILNCVPVPVRMDVTVNFTLTQ